MFGKRGARGAAAAAGSVADIPMATLAAQTPQASAPDHAALAHTINAMQESYDKSMVAARAATVSSAKNVRLLHVVALALELGPTAVWGAAMLCLHVLRAIPVLLLIYVISYVLIAIGDGVIFVDQIAFGIVNGVMDFVNTCSHIPILWWWIHPLDWGSQQWYIDMQEIADVCPGITDGFTILVGLIAHYAAPTTLCPSVRIMKAIPMFTSAAGAIFDSFVYNSDPGPDSCQYENEVIICYWIRLGYIFLLIIELILIAILLISLERLLFRTTAFVGFLVQLPVRIYLWMKHAGRADSLGKAHKMLSMMQQELADGTAEKMPEFSVWAHT